MQKILLIQLRQLGDILLTTPCTRELRKRYPHAQIDILTHTMGRLILKDNPFISHHLTYGDTDSIPSQLKAIFALRRQNYDATIDFMYNPRSALWAYGAGSPLRIAFPSRRRWAYNKIVPHLPYADYIVRQKFELLKAIDVSPSDESLILPWFERDLGPFRELSALHLKERERPRVVLSPTHRRPVRKWPLERYAALADFLVRKCHAYVIWVWGPGERDEVEKLQSMCLSETFIAPPTRFSELAALMANCDFFVGNSNGPSHVAVSTQIPTLQLHGPTEAKAWCPSNDKHHSIQGATMDAISEEEICLKVSAMMPIIKNNIKQRLAIGDRIRWDQSWV